MSIWSLTKDTTSHDMFKIIEKNNIQILNEIKCFFHSNNIRSTIIVAKGPSSCYIEEAHAINQGLLFTNKMFVYMNDFHSIFGVEEHIKDIKYIFIPDTPHIYGYPFKDISFIFFLDYLKKYEFQGNVFIYKIQSSLLPVFNFFKPYVFYSESSTDIPIQLLHRFFGIQNFNTYGYKLHNSGLYHEKFHSMYMDDKSRLDSLNWFKNKLDSTLVYKKVEEKFIRLEKIFKEKKYTIIHPLNSPIIEMHGNIKILKY